MLIKQLLICNSIHSLTKCITYPFTKNIKQIDSINQSQKTELTVDNILSQTSFKTKQPIIISQQKIRKSLTKDEKIKLKLFLPKKPFNIRLGLKQQLSYRQTITNQLYQYQYNNSSSKIKIMQEDHDQMNLDRYINYIYKDIYARFLVSKGLGVQWDTHFSSYGVLNNSQNNKFKSSNFLFQNLLQFLKQNKVTLEPTIGLYSSSQRTFLQPKDIDVQQVKKIGYFIFDTITQFGQHYQSFKILTQKNIQVKIFIFCQGLQKLIQPQAICLSHGKMVILNSFDLKHYLITSQHIYNTHRTYFQKHKYERNTIFDSINLIGMKTKYLTIIEDVEGYERQPGMYLVSGCTSLADFERVTNNGFNVKESFIRQNGDFSYNGKLINIKDPNYNQQLHKIMLEQNNIQFADTYQFFDDLVYIYQKSKQVVFYRTSKKVIVKITSQMHQEIINDINENSYIQQSKIATPAVKKLKKGRQKRRFKKQIQQINKQKTLYPSLFQSIRSLQSIPISTLKQSKLIFPIFTANDGSAMQYSQNILTILKNIQLQNKWNKENLQRIPKQIGLNSKVTVQFINISQTIIKGILFNTFKSQIQSSVIIQPQSLTDQDLPYYIVIGKLISNTSKKDKLNKRKISISHKKSNKVMVPSLIKLHPTLQQSQRSLKIQQVLYGVKKCNQKQQYGYGYQALRLWVCHNDKYLGDRLINDYLINKQIKHSSFIRKVFWQILPILNDPQIQSAKINIESQSYLSKFISDHIDYYVMNMEYHYSKLNLKDAYQLTNEFFQKYIDQIYLNIVRKNIISYKKWNIHHKNQLKKILSLLGVISPIMPFTAYHISQQQLLSYPKVEPSLVKLQKIEQYNKIVKFRVQLKNKILINGFRHSYITFKSQSDPSISIEQIIGLKFQQLAQFLSVDEIGIKIPEFQTKKFQIKLKKNHPYSHQLICTVYQYDTGCLRCDQKSKNIQVICAKCLKYLKQVV